MEVRRSPLLSRGRNGFCDVVELNATSGEAVPSSIMVMASVVSEEEDVVSSDDA